MTKIQISPKFRVIDVKGELRVLFGTICAETSHNTGANENQIRTIYDQLNQMNQMPIMKLR